MPRVAQAPPPGVVRNGTPEATPGRWWDMDQMRFRGGQLQPIGGSAQLPNTGTGSSPRDLLTWYDNASPPTRWAAIGCDAKLWAYRFDTQVLYDITPAGVGGLSPPSAPNGYGLGDYGADAYGTARDPADIGITDISVELGDRWSMDTFGQILLIVPTQDGRLFSWSPATPGTIAAPVVAAASPTGNAVPINNRGVIVTDQRQVVLLGASGDPRRIAWSAEEDYTVWRADVTNLAGTKQLVTQAEVMTAVKVSAGILIFTRNDLHMMQYVGPPYAYGINLIASGCGPASLRAVVAIGSMVAWVGAQGFWTWAGSVQPLPCDVQDWFLRTLNRDYMGRLFGWPNPPFAEIWWNWPDQNSTECNRYVAFNYNDPRHPWIIGTRQRTAADQIATMDYPILGGAPGALYLHEYGYTENGSARASNGIIYAESGAMALGEGDQRMNVTQVVVDADCPPNMLAFTFTAREQPFDAASETTAGPYSAVHNGLIDCRFSGRTTRMRVEALQDGPFVLGHTRLVMSPAGRR